MTSYLIKIIKPSGEEKEFSYEDTKILFLKRASIGNLNQIFPQNFDLIEPLITGEQDTTVYKIFENLARDYEDNSRLIIKIIESEENFTLEPLTIYDDYIHFISYSILTMDEVNYTIKNTYPAKYYVNMRISNKQDMI